MQKLVIRILHTHVQESVLVCVLQVLLQHPHPETAAHIGGIPGTGRASGSGGIGWIIPGNPAVTPVRENGKAVDPKNRLKIVVELDANFGNEVAPWRYYRLRESPGNLTEVDIFKNTLHGESVLTERSPQTEPICGRTRIVQVALELSAPFLTIHESIKVGIKLHGGSLKPRAPLIGSPGGSL